LGFKHKHVHIGLRMSIFVIKEHVQESNMFTQNKKSKGKASLIRGS